MPKKKHRLFIEEEAEFTLFGIIGSLKAVTLAWQINQMLNIDFKFQGSIKLDDTKKATSSEHPYFSFFDEANLVNYHLFVNKDGKNRLLPELDKMDYFLKIEDSNAQILADSILNNLKAVQSINFALEIDPEKLKNQENLLTE